MPGKRSRICLRRAQAFVGLGRRHADVDDRDVAACASPRDGAGRPALPDWATTSKPDVLEQAGDTLAEQDRVVGEDDAHRVRRASRSCCGAAGSRAAGRRRRAGRCAPASGGPAAGARRGPRARRSFESIAVRFARRGSARRGRPAPIRAARCTSMPEVAVLVERSAPPCACPSGRARRRRRATRARRARAGRRRPRRPPRRPPANDGEELVAVAVDLVPPVGLDGLRNEPAVSREDLAVAVAEPLDELRRAFDVGEERVTVPVGSSGMQSAYASGQRDLSTDPCSRAAAGCRRQACRRALRPGRRGRAGRSRGGSAPPTPSSATSTTARAVRRARRAP